MIIAVQSEGLACDAKLFRNLSSLCVWHRKSSRKVLCWPKHANKLGMCGCLTGYCEHYILCVVHNCLDMQYDYVRTCIRALSMFCTTCLHACTCTYSTHATCNSDKLSCWVQQSEITRAMCYSTMRTSTHTVAHYLLYIHVNRMYIYTYVGYIYIQSCQLSFTGNSAVNSQRRNVVVGSNSVLFPLHSPYA